MPDHASRFIFNEHDVSVQALMYVSGLLEPHQAEAFEKRLGEDQRAREILADVTQAILTHDGGAPAVPSPTYRFALRARLHRMTEDRLSTEKRVQPSAKQRTWIRAAVATAAAVLLIFAAGYAAEPLMRSPKAVFSAGYCSAPVRLFSASIDIEEEPLQWANNQYACGATIRVPAHEKLSPATFHHRNTIRLERVSGGNLNLLVFVEGFSLASPCITLQARDSMDVERMSIVIHTPRRNSSI